MRRFGCVVLFAMFALGLRPQAARACSMCRCGDPIFSLVGSQIFVPETWHLGLDMGRYSKEQGGEQAGAREAEVEDRLTLSATRTFGRHFTLALRLPMAARTISTDGASDSLSGFSDPEIVGYYRLRAPRPGSWLSASLGVRLGWGESNAQSGGERAEEHLQPGTGAYGLEPGLAFSHVTGAADDGALFGSLMARVNGRNDAGYHYGDAVLASFGFEKKLGSRLNVILQSDFRHAGHDEVTVEAIDPNTGGSVVYLSPRLVVKIDQRLFLRLGVQVPVGEWLYGDQDEKVNVIGGFTVRF